MTGFLDVSTSITLNDLELSKRGFGKKNVAIFGCSAHIATKWLEIDHTSDDAAKFCGDRPTKLGDLVSNKK